MSVDVWTGFTLALGTTGITVKVRKWTWNAPQKAQVDVSHQGTTQASADRQYGGREYKLGLLSDPGEWVFEILHEPTTNWPVKSGAVFETLTLQPPAQVCSGAFVATGKLLAPPQFSHGIDTEPVATIAFKLSGVVTMPST